MTLADDDSTPWGERPERPERPQYVTDEANLLHDIRDTLRGTQRTLDQLLDAVVGEEEETPAADGDGFGDGMTAEQVAELCRKTWLVMEVGDAGRLLAVDLVSFALGVRYGGGRTWIVGGSNPLAAMPDLRLFGTDHPEL